jgi:hypothetical protein
MMSDFECGYLKHEVMVSLPNHEVDEKRIVPELAEGTS